MDDMTPGPPTLETMLEEVIRAAWARERMTLNIARTKFLEALKEVIEDGRSV
jgi:hypothetical protein